MPDMITLKIGNKIYDIRDSRIGDLADLNTTDKDSVVDAINETLIRTGPTDQQVQAAVDDYLDNHPTIGGTFTNEAKNALIALLEKVAYIDGNGQTYLDALTAELFAVTVTSITAVFTQGSAVIYDTDSLDALKQYLVVTANYSDGSSETITDYTLSGTLTKGTSTITVSYTGKTTTFNVAVTHGFLYTTADGKLSEQSYVTYTNTSNSVTETLTNDGTRIYSPKVSTQTGNVRWEFLDYNLDSDCEMTVQFKIVSLGWFSNTNVANLGYFVATIYNGETGGGAAGFARYGSNSGAIKIRTAVGDPVSWDANVSVDVWHEVKISVNNGLQTVTLDGATVISNQNPSTRINYGANTMIRAGESASGINDVYIRRIEFKEVS